jgi:uncharacterized protein (TIGR00255 family)
MTGYGGKKTATPFGQVSVELKTVNHRYLEFSARVPREYLWTEEKLRAMAQSRLSRGKVDCFLCIDAQGSVAARVKVDEALAAEYLASLAKLVDSNIRRGSVGGCGDGARINSLYGVDASDFLRMPGVITLEPPQADAAALWEAICPVAESALDELLAMRSREGTRLVEDILSHLVLLENELKAVAALAPQTVTVRRERLEERMRDLLADRAVDEARLLTETALFAEKIAVDEETSRLAGHIAHMRKYLLQTDEPIGRKLDFLTQEMNREANTIGSKALDSAVTARVLEMKSEIEKIREQVQNIE